MSAWQVFKLPEPRRAFGPRITITKHGLSLSPAAMDLLGKPQRAEFLFDREKQLAAVRAAEGEAGWSLAPQSHGWFNCRMRGLLAFINREGSLTCQVALDGDLLVADLADAVSVYRHRERRTAAAPAITQPEETR